MAQTEAQKELCYRLRYEVYVNELKKVRSPDQNGVFRDWMDENAMLFVAMDRGREEDHILGSLRTNFRRNGKIELEDFYGVERYKPYFPNRISTTSKLVVRKDRRLNGITWKLAAAAFESGLRNGTVFDFINVNVNQAYLLEFYNKMGYRRCGPNFEHPEYGESIPVVISGYDLEHLRKVDSPFVRIAEDYFAEHERICDRLSEECRRGNNSQQQ